jgi:tetratricopeptide (TPR) repeat protein
MNFFKKLFGSNQDSNPRPNQQTQNRVIEGRNVTKFQGLDLDFIDLFYFTTEEEKIAFKAKLLEILEELGITNETSRTEFMERFPNYISEKEIDLPFIAELFSFQSSILMISIPDETIIESKEGYAEQRGKEKLQHYYTALRLASHNLSVKNDNRILDISDEEKLILNSLSDAHKDFARANILLQLGNSFMQQNNFDKMEYYYDKILSADFDLSPNTIADFVRAAGEDFYKIGKLPEALKYFKKGLDLNPKLGVKKVVTEIEKTINH